MNETEKKFLLTVEKGDLGGLKEMLELKDLNINCRDPLARSALVIAIDNENLAMVKILIEAGIQIGDALLYAIDENFVEAVELLLDHKESLNGITRQDYIWERDSEHSSFSADITPLILAAHRQNFEVIKMLLDRRVAPIPDPHDPRCDCSACYQARASDCLQHSRARINAYRALASPCLMALSSPDPLLAAFQMSTKLENLARLEPEYRADYLRLRAQCQTFATRLLDHAQTSKELEVLLNYSDEFLDDHDHENADEVGELCCQGSLYEMSTVRFSPKADTKKQKTNAGSQLKTSISNTSLAYNNTRFSKKISRPFRNSNSILSLDSVTDRHEFYGSHMRLARLRLAIQCKQKTFCAHPNIQELLATMWYENLPGFRRKSFIKQVIQVLYIGLMFPIYSAAYLIAPRTQLGRFIKKPFIKFICHSASYITFLFLLILASHRVDVFYSWNSISSLFSRQPDGSSVLSTEVTLNQLKQHMRLNPDVTQADIDNFEIWYKQQASSDPSSARSLNSLSKIFEELPSSSKKRGSPPSPIELIILIWVLALIWAEIKQIRALGINYYKSDMWNTLDSVASSFYIGTIILRLISYVQSDENSIGVAREHWDAYDPILLSEGLFAAATIFSSLKLVYIFSVNPYLGPLQISIGRMIVDIVRFSWIYLLVVFSFACGMNQLLWYYADLERHQCVNITNYMLAQYYNAQEPTRETVIVLNATLKPEIFLNGTFIPISNGSSHSNSSSSSVEHLAQQTNYKLNQNMSAETVMEAALNASLEDDSSKPPVTMDDSCKTWRHFANLFEASQTLFWANFGLVDLSNFDLTGIRQYTHFWALLMFGCYCFINVVVVLNLLIAMMNHSYVKISKRSDVEWKFARTRLWMSYFDTGSTVPAPFNIVPSVKSMVNMACLIFRQIHSLIKRPFRMVYQFFTLLLGGKNPRDRADIKPNVEATARPASSSSINSSFVSCDRLEPDQRRERGRMHCTLTASYRNVMRSLVRRYLVFEQRLLERKRELTEAKLNRWAKLNAFD